MASSLVGCVLTASGGILAEHFSSMAGYLALALVESGVPGETVDAMIGAIAPLADDIVSKSA